MRHAVARTSATAREDSGMTDGCERTVPVGRPCGQAASFVEHCHKCGQTRFLCAVHGSERYGRTDHAITSMISFTGDPDGRGERVSKERYEADGCALEDVEIVPL